MGDTQGGIDVATLRKAVDCLHIRDIYLRDAEIRVDDEYLPKLHGGEQLEIKLRWGPKTAKEMLWTNNETKESERIFLVLIHTAVRFVSTADKDKPTAEVKPKAEISASYMAEYKINTSDAIPGAAFEEFAKHNVIYHVWPYWREWLQSTCARTQLPSFTLPMYVIRPKEADTAQQKAGESAKS